MQSFTYSSKWMAVALSSDGLITSLSFSAEQFTGYSSQELVGQPLTQILADRSVFEVPRMMDLARERGYWEGEMAHRANDGKLFEAHSNLLLLAGCGNYVSGFLLISSLDRALVLSKKGNGAVGEVAANLRMFAHELNNPLAVLMGFVQLLMLNSNCQGKIRADIQKLDSELRRVIQVVEKLHAYAIALHEQPQADKAWSALSL